MSKKKIKKEEEFTREELIEIEKGKQRIAELSASMRPVVDKPIYLEKEVLRMLKLNLKELEYMVSRKRIEVKLQGTLDVKTFYPKKGVDEWHKILCETEIYSKNAKALLLYGQDFFDGSLERSEAINFLNVSQLYFKNMLFSRTLKPYPNPLNIEVYLIQDLEDLIMMYGVENSQDEDLWVTQKRAAEILGMSVTAVAKKVWFGHLREYKHFGRPYYRTADLTTQGLSGDALTVSEACKRLKINDISLTELVFKGKLAETREGHRRYYDKAEVDRLYEEDKYWIGESPDWMTASDVLIYLGLGRKSLAYLIETYKPIKVRNKYWFEKSKIIKDDLL